MNQYTITQDGVALPITAPTKIQVFSMDGLTARTNQRTIAAVDAGSNWAAGVIGVTFTDAEIATMTVPELMLVVTGPNFVKRFRIAVQSPTVVDKSLLFIKDYIVDELRRDRLTLLAQSFFPGFVPTDDFLWNKIKSAESEIARTLRVPLVPTKFFANTPTDAQVAALAAGMPYDVDPGYDYHPDFFQGEKWGFIVTRQKPIVSLQTIKFVYPAPTTGLFTIPGDWVRIDKKYGHIRLVPASSTFVAPLNAFLLQALGGGRTIPFAIELEYIAGLTDAHKNYPELIDAIKKMAVLKIISDGFLPSSGSISADGLSQSMSVDMSKYHDEVDMILNGPKGSNGGLMTAIHGIRVGVLNST